MAGRARSTTRAASGRTRVAGRLAGSTPRSPTVPVAGGGPGRRTRPGRPSGGRGADHQRAGRRGPDLRDDGAPVLQATGDARLPQLRLALAAESAQPRLLTASKSDINEDDTVDDIISKVAYADASAVEETAQQLDRDALTRAADAIAAATRVDLYGIAASGVVALDAQQKLHRIGVLAFAWNDPHVALTSATLLGPGDVAIGISHSGTTKETIESLAKARSRGATTIAITNFPLSRLVGTADIVLTTAARETSLRSGATASRIAALTVVDCLYIAVAHRDLDRATKAVAETRAAVAGHHV